MNIGRRIYFKKSTGEVVLDTGERRGDVVETTIEQDFNTYSALADQATETIGYLEFEYGQHAQEFASCTSYKVNVTTKAIEFSYA